MITKISYNDCINNFLNEHYAVKDKHGIIFEGELLLHEFDLNILKNLKKDDPDHGKRILNAQANKINSIIKAGGPDVSSKIEKEISAATKEAKSTNTGGDSTKSGVILKILLIIFLIPLIAFTWGVLSLFISAMYQISSLSATEFYFK